MTAPAKTAPMREDVTQAQDERRGALVERLGTFADLLCQAPLPGDAGDVAYELIRQAAAQIASDRQQLARLAHTARPDAGDGYAIATAKARLSIAAVKSRNRGDERGLVSVHADDIAVLLAAHSDQDRQLSRPDAGDADVERVACRFDGIGYSELDLEIAQKAACAIVPLYGDGSPGEQDAARAGKLWNDHPAVQGALRALHESRSLALAARREGVDRGMVEREGRMGSYQENVAFLLSRCPYAIRCHEGGGSESMVGSLVLTFTNMQERLAGAKETYAKIADKHAADAAEDVEDLRGDEGAQSVASGRHISAIRIARDIRALSLEQPR